MAAESAGHGDDAPGRGGPVVAERRALLVGFAAAAGAAALQRRAGAGPIAPPPGPVSPTGRPLAEVEPRTAVGPATTPGSGAAVYIITQPGSYYLTGNISVPAGRVGVRIQASRVQLDLNGFCIDGGGRPGTGGIDDGSSARADIHVCSGSVINVAGVGVSLGLTERSVIEGLRVRGCGAEGILIGNRGRLDRCDAEGCALAGGGLQPGIAALNEVVITRCTSRGNSGGGIWGLSRCVIQECIAAGNTGVGIQCEAGVVQRCISVDNTQAGIASARTVGSCAMSGNDSGVLAVGDTSVLGCASRASRGPNFNLGDASVASECAASLSVSPTGAAPGFRAVSGTVRGCVSFMNAGHGIELRIAGTAEGCVCRNNVGHGVFTEQGYARIVNNTCTGSGNASFNSANIRISGPASRVEGNLATGATGQGIIVPGVGTLITGNVCASNAVNWNISPGNSYGPIISRISPPTGGMAGSGPAPSTLSTTDPYANFTI